MARVVFDSNELGILIEAIVHMIAMMDAEGEDFEVAAGIYHALCAARIREFAKEAKNV